MSDNIVIKNAKGDVLTTLPPYYVDGPQTPQSNVPYNYDSNIFSLTSSSAPSTSITLYGKGVSNYNERIQQNIVYMLEHFASPIPPTKPMFGQIWMNTASNKLNVYKGVWIDDPLIIGPYPTENMIISSDIAPNNPQINDWWKDTSSNTIYRFMGSWVGIIDDNTVVINEAEQHNQIDTTGYNNTTVLPNHTYTFSYDTNSEVLSISDSTNVQSISIPVLSKIDTLSLSHNITNKGIELSLSNNSTPINIDLSNVETKRQPYTIHRDLVISNGQTKFTTTTNFELNSNKVWVFLNGQKQYESVHYTEINSNTIEFGFTVPNGEIVEMLIFD